MNKQHHITISTQLDDDVVTTSHPTYEAAMSLFREVTSVVDLPESFADAEERGYAVEERENEAGDDALIVIYSTSELPLVVTQPELLAHKQDTPMSHLMAAKYRSVLEGVACGSTALVTMTLRATGEEVSVLCTLGDPKDVSGQMKQKITPLAVMLAGDSSTMVEGMPNTEGGMIRQNEGKPWPNFRYTDEAYGITIDNLPSLKAWFKSCDVDSVERLQDTLSLAFLDGEYVETDGAQRGLPSFAVGGSAEGKSLLSFLVENGVYDFLVYCITDGFPGEQQQATAEKD